MEEKLVKAFDAVHMDDGCAETIEQAMTRKTKRRSPVLPALRTAAAACLVLVLVLLMNPTAAHAVEQIVESVKAFFPWKPGVVVLEDTFTYYNDGQFEITQQPGSTAASTRTNAPVWLKEKDGRIYFLANLQNMDITGLFSDEEPFTYVYEKEGIIHYIAVGGSYDPQAGLNSIGYGEWLRRADEMEEGIAEGDFFAGWLGGGGSMKYRDAEGDLLAVWYAKAIVELDIPWDNTAAREQLQALDATE